MNFSPALQPGALAVECDFEHPVVLQLLFLQSINNPLTTGSPVPCVFWKWSSALSRVSLHLNESCVKGLMASQHKLRRCHHGNTWRARIDGSLRKSKFQKLIFSISVCLFVAVGPKPSIL